MGHDELCELLPVPGYPSPRDTCHCATRAYVRDPFRPDGGPVVPHPHAPQGDRSAYWAWLIAGAHQAIDRARAISEGRP